MHSGSNSKSHKTPSDRLSSRDESLCEGPALANELGVTSGVLLRLIKRQKLKYFGHLKRHDCLERIVMEGRVEGKRSRGRTKQQWNEDVVEWLGMDSSSAGRTAANRTVYRSSVTAATFPADRRQ